jgi:predicted DNA-binding protein YlxM (UPF0122 family)
MMIARAKRARKRLGSFYALKAMVELGKGWHTFKEVLEKMIEITGNTKLKYYPIQDTIKYGLAILEPQYDKPTGELKVKLRDELYDMIAEQIDDYIRKMEQEINISTV